jgi:hypothetical protein
VELERRAERNRDADTSRYGHDFFIVGGLSPHLAPSGQEVPDLFNGAVSDCDRRLSSRQLEVGEATAPHLQENANIGSVGGDGISNRRQWLCLEPSLHAAPKRRGKTRRSGIDMLVRCDAEVKVAAT